MTDDILDDEEPTQEYPTLLEWAIDHDALVVFRVERKDGQGWGGNAGNWGLA